MVTKPKIGPFGVNVRDIINRPGEMRELERTIPLPTKWGEGLVAIACGTELFESVRIESVHEGILATADASVLASGNCGRCLREMTMRVKVEIQELFAYRGDESSDYEVHDDHVDLEPPLRDAVVLSLPFQPVCESDCPGLDPETGQRRTTSPDTESTSVADPRWAALYGFTVDSSADASSAEDREES